MVILEKFNFSFFDIFISSLLTNTKLLVLRKNQKNHFLTFSLTKNREKFQKELDAR